ncbi:MAG: penicillin-binding protein [Akkermansiaceae bacterium]|nr:penicillin-binding protein [Akkermansiaceae bacterium]
MDDEYLHRRAMAEGRMRRKDSAKRSGSWLKRVVKRLFFLGLALGVLCAVGGYVGFMMVTAKYSRWADEFNLEDVNNLDHPCIIYDRNGKEIGRIFDENRSYVTIDQVSQSMIDALVAQEDKSFWSHSGYDLVGIARAVKETMMSHGQANQGASTITQQLARNAYDLERRMLASGGTKYERKFVEIFLAIRLEKRYSKKQLLEFYLNRINFGRGYYGIRAAALGYYGKEPADLTVRESASLAALIKNPGNYNPIKNPELNLRWRNDVIDRMQRLNYLTAKEAERVKKLPLGVNPKPLRRQTSFFHALVQQQTISLFENPERGEEIVKSAGIRVYTTIDADLQAAAEEALHTQLESIEARKDYNHVRYSDPRDPKADQHRYLDGVVYAVDNKTGATLVYVAGRNFERDNFDIIESGRRPVGTALLPFLYMCAFDNGYSPSSRLVDDAMDNRLAGIGGSEGILGEWGMEVEKGRYMDAVTARQALEWSKIAASARLGMALSAKTNRAARIFIDTLSRAGITPPPRNPGSTEARPTYYPRVYLGTEPASIKEMVLAYTIFPNTGKRPVAPYIITKVTDSNGTILWENPLHTANTLHSSTSPCTAYRLHSIMRESLKQGSATRVQPYLPDNFNGAVKSGTNYDFADTSLFGYNSSLTCGVWIGFLNDRKAIYPEAFASDVCSPVLGAVLRAAQGKYEDQPIPMPADTESVEICLHSGQVATNYCYKSVTKDGNLRYERPTYSEYFPKGDVSLGTCSVHGDGSPSLGDLLDRGQGSFSRVLPVAPILPKGLALLGDDPYGSQIELNPRYKDADKAEGAAASLLSDEDALPAEDDAADDSGQPAVDSEEELRMPLPLRYFPTQPLRL